MSEQNSEKLTRAEAQGLDYRIGIAAGVAIVPVLSFLLHNFWRFRPL